MHKVEGDVSLAHLRLVVSDQGLTELCEDRSWRCLRLHEPTMVETKVALGELHPSLLFGLQFTERGQHLRVVLHDVTQRMVVVSNRIACNITTVRFVLLLHHWKKDVHLHDVVDGGQGEQRLEALLIHLDLCCRLEKGARFLLLQKSSIHEESPEEIPLCILHEVDPLVCLRHSDVVLVSDAEGLPVVVHTIGEAFLSVNVQAHHPIDGKEGANGPLVLIADGSPRTHFRVHH
mmetsp:Transcript_11808/g.29717  ORF Transcript_11808/g.29717 Transcript_11808/m.29717 type:complete len:233 (+) Transcript_11808:436-1134(+)